MNMQVAHYVTLVCAALAMGLPTAADAFPPAAAPWFKGAAAIFVLLTAVFGIFSPTPGAAKLPPASNDNSKS